MLFQAVSTRRHLGSRCDLLLSDIPKSVLLNVFQRGDLNVGWTVLSDGNFGWGAWPRYNNGGRPPPVRSTKSMVVDELRLEAGIQACRISVFRSFLSRLESTISSKAFAPQAWLSTTKKSAVCSPTKQDSHRPGVTFLGTYWRSCSDMSCRFWDEKVPCALS